MVKFPRLKNSIEMVTDQDCLAEQHALSDNPFTISGLYNQSL